MAHKVFLETPELPVGNADVIFRVKRNGKLLGRLKISKGALVWQQAGKVKGFRIPWRKMGVAAAEFGKKGRYPV